MPTERMPQPEDTRAVSAGKSEPCLDDKNKNKNKDKDKDRDEKGVTGEDEDSRIQSDKEAAASLGLHRVTERMLNTIKASKDIERNQRNVISKLALKSNGEEEEEEEEDESSEEGDDGDDEDEDGDKNSILEATKKRTIELKASKGTSLKRKKVPPALDLSSCSSGSTTAPNSNLSTAMDRRHTRHGIVESAPPNVSRFPRSTFTSRPIGKPKVQYLGKTRQIPPLPQQQGYKLKTPFVPRMPLPPWQQQQYYPYSYAAATAAPAPAPMLQAYQRPYNYPIPPRSAIPVQMPYYQEYKGYTPYTTTQRKRPQQMTTATTAVNDSDDLRNREIESNQNQPHQETEYSQLTVDDDTTFSSASDELMQGEIRIQRDVFSFEFPGNSPAIDKKMFMSICDKVWDESREPSRA